MSDLVLNLIAAACVRRYVVEGVGSPEYAPILLAAGGGEWFGRLCRMGGA